MSTGAEVNREALTSNLNTSVHPQLLSIPFLPIPIDPKSAKMGASRADKLNYFEKLKDLLNKYRKSYFIKKIPDKVLIRSM